MVALASAFVRLRPEVNKAEFQKSGDQAGAEAGSAAGKSYGEGFKRDVNGKLRDANGKLIKDSGTAGGQAGAAAGRGFGDSFGKGSSKAFGFLKQNLALAAGVFVPLGLAAAVGSIAKIGIAYEDNLNIFKTVSKATGAQMDAVADKARALGADITLPGVSAAGAAAAMTELAKAGFTVQESMDAAQATLQLARVAGMSEAEAAEIAANAVNAFGIEAKDTTFVVDELAAAANSSSIEVSEASDAFKQAAAVFSGIQGEAVGSKEAITELNTAIAILGNNGIKGSDAGTSLKQALLQLTGPSDKAKDAMKILALNAGQASFGQQQLNDVLNGGKKARTEALQSVEKLNPGLKNQGDIAYDAAGRMRPLRDIIGLVAAGTEGLTQEQKNLAITTIFGADASRSIFALLKGGVPLYDQQRKAVLQSGAAAEFAAAKNAGLGGAIDNVKSQFENAAISIYNVAKGPLTDALTSLASVLPEIFDGVAQFSKFVYDNIGVIRDWAVAIAAVTVALKINTALLAINAAGGLIAYIKGIQIVSSVTRLWAGAQAILNASLLANPIGIAIVIITALVAAVILAYRHSETFRKIVDGAWRGIKAAIAATVDWFVNTAWPALKAAFDAVVSAVLWLWRNVILPAWNGIKAAISGAVKVIGVIIDYFVTQFHAIANVVLWLWHTIFEPVFKVLSKIVEIWWLTIRVIIQAAINVFTYLGGKVLGALRAAFDAAFSFIKNKIVLPWWTALKAIFNAFRTYVIGPVVAAVQFLVSRFVSLFNIIAGMVSRWWNNSIRPIFAAVRAGWNTLASGFISIWTGRIRPLFEQFIGFFKKQVVGGFNTAVAAIKAGWDKVRAAARTPVAFVVNKVINPFINGLNAAARIVGVKDRVSPISGFAAGGKISGAGGMTDNRQAIIPGKGAVQLMGGEFIVERNMTARALPLLRWVNDGMKSGQADRYLGKPVADMPGDGSGGWAFKSGGLVGWLGDVWDAVSHPIDSIKKPFENGLGQIPGVGMIRNFLVGSGKRLLNGAVSWLGRIAGGGGKVGSAVSFLRKQDGKPYSWASAGPNGYDCSGIVSAVWNILHNRSPYSHTFSTANASSYFPKSGQNGQMAAAWSHPGQSPAGNSVGHMMGRVGNLNFESTGSRGVHLGNTTRKLSDFASVGHYSGGGLFGKPVQLFDQGGYWPSGTLGANLSGRTEYVNPRGGGGGGDIHFHRGAFDGAIMANSGQVEDIVVGAIKSAQRHKKLP